MHDISPISHLKHASAVTGVSVGALVGTQGGDAMLFGWTVGAALVAFVTWLIATGVLHVTMLDWLYRDAKRDKRDADHRREQAEERKADRARIQALEDIVRRNGLA